MAMVLGADVVWSNSHCNARPALRQMRQHPICNSAKSSAGSVISSLSMAYFPHCRHRQRIMQPCRATASSGGAGQPVPQSGGAASSQRAQQLKRAGSQSGNALFGLIVINLIIFFLDHVMQQVPATLASMQQSALSLQQLPYREVAGAVHNLHVRVDSGSRFDGRRTVQVVHVSWALVNLRYDGAGLDSCAVSEPHSASSMAILDLRILPRYGLTQSLPPDWPRLVLKFKYAEAFMPFAGSWQHLSSNLVSTHRLTGTGSRSDLDALHAQIGCTV